VAAAFAGFGLPRGQPSQHGSNADEVFRSADIGQLATGRIEPTCAAACEPSCEIRRPTTYGCARFVADDNPLRPIGRNEDDGYSISRLRRTLPDQRIDEIRRHVRKSSSRVQIAGVKPESVCACCRCLPQSHGSTVGVVDTRVPVVIAQVAPFDIEVDLGVLE
jgi:hypothetical protein